MTAVIIFLFLLAIVPNLDSLKIGSRFVFLQSGCRKKKNFSVFSFSERVPPQVDPERTMGKCFTSTGMHLIAMAAILTRRQKWTIKVLMALVLMACYHNSLCVRSYLLRAALVPPLSCHGINYMMRVTLLPSFMSLD